MATTNAQSQSSMMDTVKLLVALLLVVAAIVGFYYFESESLLYRVLGLLAVVVVAGVALTTQVGKQLISFMGSSRTEVRKMVWPTRNETTQTTLIVIVLVAILAVFLLIIDSILGWAVKVFLGTGA